MTDEETQPKLGPPPRAKQLLVQETLDEPTVYAAAGIARPTPAEGAKAPATAPARAEQHP